MTGTLNYHPNSISVKTGREDVRTDDVTTLIMCCVGQTASSHDLNALQQAYK